eukprot:SAG11_NODE_28644_length_319_cov_0.981818_1_plen_38_part_10
MNLPIVMGRQAGFWCHPKCRQCERFSRFGVPAGSWVAG